MPLTEEKYKSDWDFLKCVYSLLDDGNVLNTTSDKPVVSFKFPDELKVNSMDKICRVRSTIRGTILIPRVLCTVYCTEWKLPFAKKRLKKKTFIDEAFAHVGSHTFIDLAYGQFA